MRLVVFGQAPFGRDVLEGLIAAGHEIAVVFAPADAGGRVDPLAEAAREAGLRLETPAHYKGADVLEAVESADADLGVLAFVTKIIPQAVIDAPREGTICYHPSLLPKYRGGSALAWQLIGGETRGGYTIFWTDAGVDSGPVLLQREIAIGPEESAGSYYFSKLFEPSVAAMVEAVGMVAQGTAPRIEQDHAEATHDPLCTDEHAEIDWKRSARQVHDLVRGCDPQPGARTLWSGQRLRLYGSSWSAGTGELPAPGTVVALGEDHMDVVAGLGAEAGVLSFGKARGAAGKGSAAAVARELGVAVGNTLGGTAAAG